MTRADIIRRVFTVTLVFGWVIFVCWLGAFSFEAFVRSNYWREGATWLSEWLAKAGVPDSYLVIKFYAVTTWTALQLLLTSVPLILWIRFKSRRNLMRKGSCAVSIPAR